MRDILVEWVENTLFKSFCALFRVASAMINQRSSKYIALKSYKGLLCLQKCGECGRRLCISGIADNDNTVAGESDSDCICQPSNSPSFVLDYWVVACATSMDLDHIAARRAQVFPSDSPIDSHTKEKNHETCSCLLGGWLAGGLHVSY